MKDSFNFNRFGKYFLYDLNARWCDLGIFFLVFALFPFIFYLIYMVLGTLGTNSLGAIFAGDRIDGPALIVRFITFAIVTGLFVILFPARAYGFITEKKAGSDYLMLPASRAEKFTSMMLISLVVIPVAFVAIYFISDWLLCLLDKTCGNSMLLTNLNELGSHADVLMVGNGIPLLLATMAESIVIFLLGSLIFKKWKVGYTIIALFAINMVLSIIMGMVFGNLNPENIAQFMEKHMMKLADHLELYINLWIDAALILLVGGCGIWSWFRLKKQQH